LIHFNWEVGPILLLRCLGRATLILIPAGWERSLVVLKVFIVLEVLLLLLDIENKLTTISGLELVFFLNTHGNQLF